MSILRRLRRRIVDALGPERRYVDRLPRLVQPVTLRLSGSLLTEATFVHPLDKTRAVAVQLDVFRAGLLDGNAHTLMPIEWGEMHAEPRLILSHVEGPELTIELSDHSTIVVAAGSYRLATQRSPLFVLKNLPTEVWNKVRLDPGQGMFAVRVRALVAHHPAKLIARIHPTPGVSAGGYRASSVTQHEALPPPPEQFIVIR